MIKNRKKKEKVIQKNPAKLFFYAYVITILTGGTLLSLPISSQSGEFTHFMDAIFTATSAVCVTGLTPVITSAHWNAFGNATDFCRR